MYSLVAHPDYPAPIGVGVEVDIEPADDGLSIIFNLRGNGSEVVIPSATGGGRRDGLWQHTCFEAFVRCATHERYLEYNFSPAGDWAAYSFDRYREGMRALPIEDKAFALRGEREPWWTEGRWWSFATGSVPLPDVEWQVGLSAVIEARDGSKSFWALDHAPGPPDFHNPACFKLRFLPPTQA